ncbi:MAG: endonuclease [Bacteroidaceae bacterium]|nr:endonuclease [Bacteroidaceae bacterium]
MNKLRLFSLNLLLFVAVSLSAVDFTTSYYTSANGKKGESLKTALYNIIKNPDVTSYDGLYTAYKKTDNRVIGGTTYVRDWYSTTTRYKHVTDKAGSYSKEGDCYNREHSVPQSWFGSGNIKSDIVHVLPTDGYVNNRRGNYPFGEVGTATYTSNGGYCKLGSAKSGLGYSGTVFEPADEIKGDLARIYFYMATCYQDKCTSWGNNVFTGTTYSPLSSWSLTMFMRWSEEDPVDDIEIARNNAVQDVQGNRNPFVDFPGLEQYVWGSLKTTAISVTSYDNPYDTSGLTTPTFNFNGTNVVKVLGDAAFQYQATTNSDGTIQYASSNTNVATVSSNGTVTIVGVGTTTITASVAQTNTYKAASASYLLTVKASADDPTEATGDYVKVTTAPSDWSGTYLIVYEDGGVALNGGLTTLDAVSNTISVTISNNTIASTSTTDAASFTIASKSDGYSIKSASGLYMGQTSDANGLKSGTTDSYTNAISLSGSDADIVSGGAYLRYNASSGQTRFRYYKSGSYTSQKAIQLYKKSEGSGTGGDPTPTGPVDPTVTFTTSVLSMFVGETVVNEADTNSDGQVTYSSSNTQVATVDAESGLVTALSAGQTTITATVSATDNYNQGSASYTLTVVESSGTGSTTEDELTATVLDLPSSYGDVSGKTATSGTVYAANGMTNTSKDYIQMRSSNNNSGIVSTSSVGTIAKVTVTWSSNTASGRVLNIYGSNTAYTSPTDLYDSSKQGTLLGTIVYGTSTELAVSGNYAYVGIRSNANALYANSIRIQWNTGSGTTPTPVAPTVSFATATKSLTVGETFTQAVTTNSNGAVTYTSSNPQVATVEAATGKVTAVSAGTATITANVAATSNYTAGTATYTVTVTASGSSTLTGSGTQTDPYTVADVLQLFADNNVPSTEVYVSGIVSQIKSLDVSKYTRAQYYISDDGTTTDQFYVYNGLYLDGANFTSNDQLQVADQVVVLGTLTTYGNTNEFAANSKIVSLVRPSSGPVAPTASFASASKTLTVGATYTQTLTTNSDGAVTYASSNASVATVNAQTGLVTAVAAGTATITATVAATDNFTAATATYTVTVTASGSGLSTDELTATVLDLGTSYGDVTGKTAASGTVYAAHAMTNADKEFIQMRSNNNNSGIVSTASVGTVNSVTVDWTSTTQSGRVLNIYGSNTAYSSPADLYDSSKQGALLGTIVYGTSTSLTVSDDYAYIGIRSNSGALYATGINIVWNITSGALMNPSASFEESAVTLTVGDTYMQTVNTNSDGAVTYSSSDPAVATVDASTGLVTAAAAGTATITANIAATSTYNAAAPTYTVTVVAAEQSLDYNYVKVTSEPTDWSGTYLIVNEEASVALDGGRETLNAASGQSNCITVTIEEGQIAATTYTAAAEFTVAKMTDGYSIKAASGGFLGLAKGKSGMDTSSEAIANTLAYHSDGDSVTIACTSVVTSSGVSTDTPVRLRFNANNGTPLFRYYSYSTALQSVQLYKKVSSGEEPGTSGDVNRDGNVSIADVTALVNIVLGKDSGTTPVYDHEAADVNQDGQVTIADVTALVNIVLGKTL